MIAKWDVGKLRYFVCFLKLAAKPLTDPTDLPVLIYEPAEPNVITFNDSDEYPTDISDDEKSLGNESHSMMDKKQSITREERFLIEMFSKSFPSARDIWLTLNVR